MIYTLSFLWYPTLAIFVAITVGIVVSGCTGILLRVIVLLLLLSIMMMITSIRYWIVDEANHNADAAPAYDDNDDYKDKNDFFLF